MILSIAARRNLGNFSLPMPQTLVRDHQEKRLEDFIEGFTAVSGGYRASLHLSDDNDNLKLFEQQDFDELQFD